MTHERPPYNDQPPQRKLGAVSLAFATLKIEHATWQLYTNSSLRQPLRRHIYRAFGVYMKMRWCYSGSEKPPKNKPGNYRSSQLNLRVSQLTTELEQVDIDLPGSTLSSIFLFRVSDIEFVLSPSSDFNEEEDELGRYSQGVGAGLLLKYLCCKDYKRRKMSFMYQNCMKDDIECLIQCNKSRIHTTPDRLHSKA